MEVIYYFDKDLGYSPVKKYLAQYANNNDTTEKTNRKNKILADIDAKINFLKQNNGIPIPPISKPLREYNFFEVRQRKDRNILIRIFYFCHNSNIVLLNAFEKPDDYDTAKENRKIKKELEITKIYQNKFILNPNLYEKYN